MKIFQSTITFLATLGITAQSRPLNVRVLMTLTILGIMVTLICAFFFLEAKSFKDYTESIYMSSVTIALFLTYSFVVWKKANIFQFIELWERIAEIRSENPISKMIYLNVVDKVEKWGQFIHFVMIKLTVPCIILPKYIVCLYLYYTTDMGKNAFELPLPMWFPFDWKNPRGFLLSAVITYSLAQFAITYAAYMISYGIGMNFYIVSIIEDVKRHLGVMSDGLKTETVDRLEIHRQITEYVQFHSDAKHIMNFFVGFLQPMFMVVFLWSTITICGAMLMIQIEITNHENDSMMLIEMAFEVFYSFCVVFISCELGERLIGEFGDIGDIIYQFDWYLLPVEVQQILPMIIINAQQAVCIECFGSMNTNRESFQKVVNTGYTYFTMIRQFY